MKKRRGIKKTVTGGKIKAAFSIKKTEQGKEVVSHKVFEEEEKQPKEK